MPWRSPTALSSWRPVGSRFRGRRTTWRMIRVFATDILGSRLYNFATEPSPCPERVRCHKTRSCSSRCSRRTSLSHSSHHTGGFMKTFFLLLTAVAMMCLPAVAQEQPSSLTPQVSAEPPTPHTTPPPHPQPPPPPGPANP